MKTMTEPDAAGLAYGSLYLDRGENMKKAKVQIKNVSNGKYPPFAWFFDVVCKEEQIAEAQEYVKRIREYIERWNPNLDTKMIMVEWTHHDHARPARSLMLHALEGRNVEEITIEEANKR